LARRPKKIPAALPDTEKHEGIAQETIKVVEQHFAEPAADEHTEDGATRDEIADFLRRDNRKPAFGQIQVDEIRDGKRREIRQSIPTHPKPVAELHGERINVVDPIGDHRPKAG
jgi:hypothetical protein